MKKYIGVFLTFICLISMLFSMPVYANAAGSSRFSYEVQEDGTACINDYANPFSPTAPGIVVLPQEIDGYRVTKIRSGFSFTRRSIKSVVIPEGFKTIGTCTFLQCMMETVYLPSSLETIEEGAFFDSGITDIVVPVGVTSIGVESIGYKSREEFVIGASAAVQKEGFVIYGYEGTAAQTYAAENEIAFVDINTLMKGNVAEDEGEQSVNMKDCLMLYRHAAGRAMLPPLGVVLGDVNNDGQTDSYDALKLYTTAS